MGSALPVTRSVCLDQTRVMVWSDSRALVNPPLVLGIPGFFSVLRGLRSCRWYQLASAAQEVIQNISAWPAHMAGMARSAPHLVRITPRRRDWVSIRTGSLAGYKWFCSHEALLISLSPCWVKGAHIGASHVRPQNMWPLHCQEKQVQA